MIENATKRARSVRIRQTGLNSPAICPPCTIIDAQIDRPTGTDHGQGPCLRQDQQGDEYHRVDGPEDGKPAIIKTDEQGQKNQDQTGPMQLFRFVERTPFR